MALTFNTNSLQDTNVLTEEIDHHGGGDRKINLLAIAHGNRSKVTDINTVSKSITLKGTIIANTPALLDDFEDTFKGYFVGKDKYLDIPHGSGTRRYIATPQTPRITRPGGLAYGKFSVTFLCAMPFGMDTTETSLATGAAVTSTPNNWAITPGGSAEYQYPIITVTLNSGTQLTGQTMSIGNNSNGQICSITRDWVAADVLVIDPLADEPVTVNGMPVEFDGSIPIFEKGSGAVTYSDTFLTRSVDYDISQYRYWI